MGVRGGYRFAEKCLYSYPENCRRLEALREEVRKLRLMTSAQAQRYQPASHGGRPASPVEWWALDVITKEGEIRRLRWVTGAVAALAAALETPLVLEGTVNEGLGDVLRTCYFEKVDARRAARRMNIERRTLYNKRVKLVRLAMRFLDSAGNT